MPGIPTLAATEMLLHEARELFRGPTFGSGFREASDAYMTALAAIPEIPDRQRRNVYEQSMYAATSHIPLAERIEAAIQRETTRTIRIAENGLRVEAVESWVRRLPDLASTVDVEVCDAQTGELWARRENVQAEQVEKVAVDLYVEVLNLRTSEAGDECEMAASEC